MDKKTRRSIVAILSGLLLFFVCSCGFMPPEDTAATDESRTAVPTPTPEPVAEPTPEPTPEPVPAKQLMIQVTQPGMGLYHLTDGSFEFGYFMEPGSKVTITSEDGEISQLYILWDVSTHEAYTIECNGTAYTVGENGFEHEYIALPEPASEVIITIPENKLVYPRLAEIYAFSEGEVPDWVQIWEPPCEKADILLFPTHSDDEYIFFGGIIPDCVSRGLEVQAAYMVSHEIAHHRRCHERLNSLWEAGCRRYPLMKSQYYLYPDEAEWSQVPEHSIALLAVQVAAIRQCKPLVIVGHDENGEYGHTLHKLNTKYLKRAVEMAADPEQCPESYALYGTWDTPKMYLHLYGEENTVLDFETPLEYFDGRTAFEVACDAYKECASQYMNGYGNHHVQAAGEDYDSHVYGLYRSLVGEDVAKNDLFEHLEEQLAERHG